MTIDLHGLTVSEAEQQTLMALLSFEEDVSEYSLEIITGVGTGRLSNAINDLLWEEGYNFSFKNPGTIVVNKK